MTHEPHHGDGAPRPKDPPRGRKTRRGQRNPAHDLAATLERHHVLPLEHRRCRRPPSPEST